MKKYHHVWQLPPQEAIRLQKELSHHVVKESKVSNIQKIGGVDTSYRENISKAAIVVFSFPDLEPIGTATGSVRLTYPYIPGLLTFREGPAILTAFQRLDPIPDILIFDGQGIAHPRRLGIASHMGLLLDLPTIGCAKTKLVGSYEEPGLKAGSFSFLTDNEETIGAVVRTKTGVKPLFVSIGHKVDLETSIKYVLGSCRGFRLPETIRQADKLAAT